MSPCSWTFVPKIPQKSAHTGYGAGSARAAWVSSTSAPPRTATSARSKCRTDISPDDDEFRRRFTAEVNAASRVRGPGVAPVVAADTDGDPPWLASEYVPGTPLDETPTGQPIPAADLPDFARGLAQALASIHAAGVVHRDLKPANVLLTAHGPRVVDFGIATAGLTRMTSTGVIIGSPGWIAPERIRGHDATPAADIWAWGACIAYAATGQSPPPPTATKPSPSASSSANPTSPHSPTASPTSSPPPSPPNQPTNPPPTNSSTNSPTSKPRTTRSQRPPIGGPARRRPSKARWTSTTREAITPTRPHRANC